MSRAQQYVFLTSFCWLLLNFTLGSDARKNTSFDILEQMSQLQRKECELSITKKGIDDSCNEFPVALENCIMRCVSPECYDVVYSADPLEEGEVDTMRRKQYNKCWKREIQDPGESHSLNL
mmetsp:Transcript_22891/g.31861  ORF Transcript_22891/g.31861 Transcript_22891/m.31861 type:complete len:121 (+) Transcript_22891:122-484(+)